jgi:hypothetical protein
VAAVDGPIRIAILTTRSVVTIQRIEPEAQSARSVMCINRTSVETGVSRAYNQFVSRSTGVVSKMTGVAAFRTDVDGEVTDGRSFEFPLFLAHLLRHERRLAGAAHGDPAAALWIASGEVDADHRVKRVDGIAEKLKILEAWLAASSNLPPVRVLLPAANQVDAASLLAGFKDRDVAVDFFDRAEDAFGDTPRAPARRRPLVAMIGAAGLALVLVGAVLLGRKSTPGPPADPPKDRSTTTSIGSPGGGSGLDVVVREMRSATDTCFGVERQQVEHHVKVGDAFTLPAGGHLCRLEIIALNAGDQHAYLIAQNEQAQAPADLGPSGSLTPFVNEKSIEIAFSPKPLEPAGNVSTWPHVTIHIAR